MTFIQSARSELDNGLPVGPQVYRLLRRRIIRNDLTPGARLSEAEIACEYDISRQPVREAFIKLADEGLVEVRPQRGTFVCKIGVSAVLGAQFVRASIESEIVAQLAERDIDALIVDLRHQMAVQADVVGSDQIRFVELDERFHRTLAEAAGQSYAWNVIEGAKAQMDRVRYLSASRVNLKNRVQQHTAVVDAIAAHDGAAARKAMVWHLSGILDDFPSVAESMQELFEH